MDNMKIHTMKQKVYYADTDAYGVVWHGAYLRWLEAARVELCEAMGLNLIDLKTMTLLYRWLTLTSAIRLQQGLTTILLLKLQSQSTTACRLPSPS